MDDKCKEEIIEIMSQSGCDLELKVFVIIMLCMHGFTSKHFYHL